MYAGNYDNGAGNQGKLNSIDKYQQIIWVPFTIWKKLIFPHIRLEIQLYLPEYLCQYLEGKYYKANLKFYYLVSPPLKLQVCNICLIDEPQDSTPIGQYLVHTIKVRLDQAKYIKAVNST